ncbi:MAG: signal peptidase II [Candidatus Latescibacteria bacterium]|nr:signal peptidase II [Candidatus Latescibacterota bacterium]
MKVLWLVPGIVALDQITKVLVERTMFRGQSIPLVGETFIRLTYIHNDGAAFGLNIGSPLIHTLVSIAALFFLIWLFWTAPRQARVIHTALAMVLGGALGNIIDRIRLGEVIDFFDVGLDTLRWPVFNIADSFVTVGVILLAFAYSRNKDEVADQTDTPTQTAP